MGGGGAGSGGGGYVVLWLGEFKVDGAYDRIDLEGYRGGRVLRQIGLGDKEGGRSVGYSR